MRVVCDIEANGLIKGLKRPSHIWVICCLNIDTGEKYVFRRITQDEAERKRFLDFAGTVTLWIGHNFLDYDYVVLCDLVPDFHINVDLVIDTLIVSKLMNFSREGGHSLEQYGLELGVPKSSFDDFSKYSQELEDRCAQDVAINRSVYDRYSSAINDPIWHDSIWVEHQFQLELNSVHRHGFCFNVRSASNLRDRVEKELQELDQKIIKAFPPREVLIREFTPKATKFGTISKTSVPRSLHGKIHEFEVGKTYPLTEMVPFNPGSPRQIVRVLNEAGWKPEHKTKTHLEVERELRHLRYSKQRPQELVLRIEELYNKLQSHQVSGWKIDEHNLSTLPEDAPSPARTLAKRILLESRRRTLVEWISCVEEDGRIHGKFYGIGCWPHRMAHQNPNTANIPTGNKLYAKEMRSLWCAPKGRLLVGVDADSIQFRIAAHYINDPSLIKKIIVGKKSDGTDPHSYNKRVIGDFCKSRDASKRTLFSLILGGGISKLAEILQCSQGEAEHGRDNLYREYPGLVKLKQEIVNADAQRGFFVGLDGRLVPIPGDTVSQRKHLCPSGYLQCGEAVVMKHATIRWKEICRKDKELVDIVYYLVNMVHDENITEGPNDVKLMLKIGMAQADAIRQVGEELGCRCPLAGSYRNDIQDFTIGKTWYEIH